MCNNDRPSFGSDFHGFADYPFTFESYPDHHSACSNHSGETASLTDSVWDYPNENGRTYHAYRAGTYHYPNDPEEVERLKIQHDIIKVVLDERNYFVPFSQENPPHKVLDIATGTGRWAIEMGDEFPNSKIIGTDLSPIQSSLVAPNVSFYVDDATEEWQHGPEWYDFDYIHTRNTSGCWTDMGTQIIQRAFERLRPGGWLECQELGCFIECDDNTYDATGPLARMSASLIAASDEAGRTINIGGKLKPWFEEAGFADVQELVFKIPMNSWPPVELWKQIGDVWCQTLNSGWQAFSYALLTKFKGMTRDDIELELVGVRKQSRDTSQHMYNKIHVVFGRKPEQVVAEDSSGRTVVPPESGAASTVSQDMSAG